MSLQVWLPLLGNLNNYGINDYTTTLASGNSWATSGKIGGHSLTLTKLQTILPTTSCMTGAKEISYAFWVKVNTPWSTNWLDGIRWIETDGSATSTARQEFYTNCTKVGTWYKGGSISDKAFTPGEWTHLAATINHNTGEAKFYINGILTGSTTNVNKTYHCRGDFYIGDNNIDICENDVRIYDHCLSAAEVKEIASGLILHYKLDSFQGEFGNPNLITNFDTSFLSYADGTTTLFTNQMNNGTQEIISNFADANKCLHLHSNGGNNRQYRTIGLAVGKTYTISADYYSTTRQTIAWRGELNGGDYSWSPASAGTYDTPGVWKRMSYTYSDLTSNATLYFFTHCANGTDCYIKNIKIEYGSSATAWSSSDISTTIIQDNSGYNHNGILTNTAFITSNTSRYSNAIYLSKVRINCTDGFPTGENPNFTISFWTKILSTITYVSYGDLIGMYDTGQGSNTFRLELCGSPAGNNLMWFRGPSGQSGGGFNMNSSSSSGWFTKDTWHHIVLAGDGINKKYYCYLDGNLCQTYSGSANSWQPTGQWYLGDTTEATAYFSDLRIYCTTLDADAIRQLYEVGAKIDNKQNFHTFELVENNSKIQITKTGLTLCNELEETTTTKLHKSNQIIETNEIIEL